MSPCPPEAGVLLKWLNRLSWFSARRLSLRYTTPRYRLIWVSPKIRVLRSGTCCHGTLSIAGVVTSVRPSHVYHAERPPLCTTCWLWRQASCSLSVMAETFVTFRLLSTACDITGECGRLSTAVQTRISWTWSSWHGVSQGSVSQGLLATVLLSWCYSTLGLVTHCCAWPARVVTISTQNEHGLATRSRQCHNPWWLVVAMFVDLVDAFSLLLGDSICDVDNRL